VSQGPLYGYHTGPAVFGDAAMARRALKRMVSDPKWANFQHVKGLHALEPAGQARPLIRYEGYGPGAAVVLVDCLTRDRERTRTLVRRTLAEHGGYLGAEGSVGYLFDRVGLLRFGSGEDMQRLTEAALSAGAEDVIVRPGAIEVLTDPEEFQAVRSQLIRMGWAPASAEVTERAALTAPIRGEAARRMVHLLEALADLDDVWNVYSNVEISDEVLARI
jgi:transcriptional/translational regulatory protein YebC/TACO1